MKLFTTHTHTHTGLTWFVMYTVYIVTVTSHLQQQNGSRIRLHHIRPNENNQSDRRIQSGLQTLPWRQCLSPADRQADRQTLSVWAWSSTPSLKQVPQHCFSSVQTCHTHFFSPFKALKHEFVLHIFHVGLFSLRPRHSDCSSESGFISIEWLIVESFRPWDDSSDY